LITIILQPQPTTVTATNHHRHHHTFLAFHFDQSDDVCRAMLHLFQSTPKQAYMFASLFNFLTMGFFCAKVGSFSGISADGTSIEIRSTQPIIASQASGSTASGTPAFTGASDYYVMIPAALAFVGIPSSG
jgi:hypothetical protein